jgi:phosphoenolpyruvate carboxykinase (GTP)
MKWVVDRVRGRAPARETGIGFMPDPKDLDMRGLDLPAGTLDELLAVDAAAWRHEVEDLGREFAAYGDRLPAELERERQALLRNLQS